GSAIIAAQAVHQDRPNDPVEYRAKTFVVASGYCWSSHLLLLSQSSRFPNGLANRSGLVGRYMNGHRFLNATANIDDQTFPGQNMTHSLISREFFRSAADKPFVRHDTRVWESAAGRDPRLRSQDGRLLLGDELMADWRSRTRGSSVRLRAYVDVHPSADSRLTLDPSKKNRFGDPMPAIEHHFDEPTLAREAATRAHVNAVFDRLARASNGRIVNRSEGDYLDHPGGGCRMGSDPGTSVTDSYGRTHDHENLFVVGAPTTPTGGCTHRTLTFVALTLRSADAIARAGRAGEEPVEQPRVRHDHGDEDAVGGWVRRGMQLAQQHGDPEADDPRVAAHAHAEEGLGVDAARLAQTTYALRATSIGTSAGLMTRLVKKKSASGTVIEEKP